MGKEIEVFGESLSPVKASESLQNINEFARVLREHLVEEQDYAVIVDGETPTLLKPGAEKIVSLLGLWPDYEIIKEVESWDQDDDEKWPIFYYMIRCRLRRANDGKQVGEGIGSCNNGEKKYRFWRGKKQKDVRDAYDQVNTILKMAEKRALVHATLTIARVSGLFSQDLEDITPEPPVTKTDEEPKAEPKKEQEEEKTQHGLIKSDLRALKNATEAYPILIDEFDLKGKKGNDITRELWTSIMARVLELDLIAEQAKKAEEEAEKPTPQPLELEAQETEPAEPEATE